MKWKAGFSSLAAIVTICFSPGAFAQETSVSADKKSQGGGNSDNDVDLSLKEILDVKVSVASLFKESELDVGSSVFSISNDEWKKQGAIRTFDAVRWAPGVMVYESNFFSAGPSLASRGFYDPGQIPSFSVLVDGINLSSIFQQSAILARPSVDLGVLDKMEMIIGPASVLYGSDALQGVVSMITPDITKDNVSAEAAGGVFGNYRAEAKVAKELVPDLHLGLNLGVSGQANQHSHVDYQSTLPQFQLPPPVPQAAFAPLAALGPNGSDTLAENVFSYGLVSKLRYKKTEAGFYYLGYTGAGFPGPGFTARSTFSLPSPYTVIPGQGPLFFQTSPGGGEANTNSSLLIGKLQQEISLPNDIDLIASGYYWNGTTQYFVGNNVGPINSSTQFDQQVNDWRGHASLVAKRSADEKFPVKVAAGYDIDYTKISSGTEQIDFAPGVLPTLPGGGAITTNLPSNGKIRSINGVFLETDSPIVGRTLHLLLDGREDFYSDFGNHFSPRAGLVLQPRENVAVKALYAHGFRAPSATELYGNPAGIVGNSTLKPDTMNTAQLQYMQRGKQWKADATAYLSYWNDQITINPNGPGGLPQYQNNPSNSRAYGLDISGKVILVSNLSLNTSGSYVRSFGSPAGGGGTAPYILFPTYILNWGLEYDIPSYRLNVAVYNRHQWDQGKYIFGPGQLVSPGSIVAQNLDDFFRTDLAVTWDVAKKPGTFQTYLTIRDLFNLKKPLAAVTANDFGQISGAGFVAIVGARASL